MKFKAKVKACQLFVIAKTSMGEAIDEKELDRFSRLYLRGFLKPKQIKKKQVEYTGPIGISLSERLKSPVSKRDFLFIIEQLVVAVQKLEANVLSIDNLVLDTNKVYINEITKEVQFIYTPVIPHQSNNNIISFIEEIVYSIKPMDENDNDYVSRFVYYFKAMTPFDINKLERFVEKEDRSVVNTIKKQNAGQSGYMTNKQQHYYEHYDDEKTALLVENDEQTGILDECEDATGLLINPVMDDEEESGTMLLTENDENTNFPSLCRVATNEIIKLNKPVFRLGKEKSCVDYFVTNNIAVSRSHADIITRGQKCFVKDLDSKNHTFINDKEIPVQCEIEIFDGDRLTLGNEEFIFSL